ncbi:uncharacterized protein BO95DRAFT_513246 [Aspergillus brunneoviolaceus CBS 621.78]|uniref:Uncharacterized protein n=1 Tax=Aspergillus brunneoviolaceus CBS 621.78 TaxID=1450534 RepID=A0ACD1GDG3_9EURO|nr:hypothetical protein BO95DRAFT_513246 [Aspergillus brunneoviolaceus CBS 621.78]RAH47252.1 hypothetical protein BO95DRAFT_513246 [Aspergillus brunneoviolaceus CBS 621.78]
MNTQVHTTLTTLDSALHTLLTTLTTSPTASGAPAAALALLAADDALTSTIDELRAHQRNYARLLGLRAEAQALEEKVRGIVREVVEFEGVVRGVCGDSDSDSEEDEEDDDTVSDYEGDGDTEMQGTDSAFTGMTGSGAKRKLRGVKEVDYKLLLDFARRISKYNHQAAADAAAGAEERVAAGQAGRGSVKDAEMGGIGAGGANGDATTAAEPVAEVTKGATSWLDESAQLARQVYMLPYPMEDRIRMGLMGQIQLAAAEGRPGFQVEAEVERLIREAEGLGVAAPVAAAPGPEVAEQVRHADEAARAAALAGSSAASGSAVGGGGGGSGSGGGSARPAAAPLPAKPKATLDLDLYDPDEDDE